MFRAGRGRTRPCIIFIDEIDTVSRPMRRAPALAARNLANATRRSQPVLVRRSDGFEANEGIVLIAATRPGPTCSIPALYAWPIRPSGASIPNPDIIGRAKICRGCAYPKKSRYGAGRQSSRPCAHSTPDSQAPISPTWSTKPRCSPRVATSAMVIQRRVQGRQGREADDRATKCAHNDQEREEMLTAYHEGGTARLVALNVVSTRSGPRGRPSFRAAVHSAWCIRLPEHDELSMSLDKMASRLVDHRSAQDASPRLVFGKNEKVTSGAAMRISSGQRARPHDRGRAGACRRWLRARGLWRQWRRGVPRLPGVAPAEHSRRPISKINSEVRRAWSKPVLRKPSGILARSAPISKCSFPRPARIRDPGRRRDQGPDQRHRLEHSRSGGRGR